MILNRLEERLRLSMVRVPAVRRVRLTWAPAFNDLAWSLAKRPPAEAVLSAVIEDAVAVLEKLGGGAATTASVLAAVPMPTPSGQ